MSDPLGNLKQINCITSTVMYKWASCFSFLLKASSAFSCSKNVVRLGGISSFTMLPRGGGVFRIDQNNVRPNVIMLQSDKCCKMSSSVWVTCSSQDEALLALLDVHQHVGVSTVTHVQTLLLKKISANSMKQKLSSTKCWLHTYNHIILHYKCHNMCHKSQ